MIEKTEIKSKKLKPQPKKTKKEIEFIEKKWEQSTHNFSLQIGQH